MVRWRYGVGGGGTWVTSEGMGWSGKVVRSVGVVGEGRKMVDERTFSTGWEDRAA